jgi:hypothetical protein
MLQQLPNLRELTDAELDALYKRCFKPGHTNLFSLPEYKFGASDHIEREVFRRRILAEGWTPNRDTSIPFDTMLDFEITRRRQEFHRQDSHYREYSSIRTTKVEHVSFTSEELEHIINHFSNANDPFVQAIAAKAQKMIDALCN